MKFKKTGYYDSVLVKIGGSVDFLKEFQMSNNSNNSVVEFKNYSPEYVAFLLSKELWSGLCLPCEEPEEYLELYAKCLLCVQGKNFSDEYVKALSNIDILPPTESGDSSTSRR